MPKQVGRFTIEHWRDGEMIAKVDLTNKVVQRSAEACRIVLPPGTLTLTTGDEVRFNIDGLIERLTEIRSCPAKN